jgi:hypothetical protein
MKSLFFCHARSNHNETGYDTNMHDVFGHIQFIDFRTNKGTHKTDLTKVKSLKNVVKTDHTIDIVMLMNCGYTKVEPLNKFEMWDEIYRVLKPDGIVIMSPSFSNYADGVMLRHFSSKFQGMTQNVLNGKRDEEFIEKWMNGRIKSFKHRKSMKMIRSKEEVSAFSPIYQKNNKTKEMNGNKVNAILQAAVNYRQLHRNQTTNGFFKGTQIIEKTNAKSLNMAKNAVEKAKAKANRNKKRLSERPKILQALRELFKKSSS